MPRVKGGPRARKRHKKILKMARGYRGARSKTFKRAHEAVIRAGEHSFHGRKKKKRDLRRLWITRINAALDTHNLKYSRFIAGLKKTNIQLNRKMLSEIAIHDPKTFDEVVFLTSVPP
ncbi:50S ribosomal protein L20 [bacterium]|nr:50S ribosomal protein L20 [bacterium]